MKLISSLKRQTRSNFLVLLYISALFFLQPILQVFGIVLLALYLFTSEKFPVDITAILIMLLLMLLGLVSPEQGVSGFSNSATITVLCMFILSGGIAKTGVIQYIGHLIFKFAKKSQTIQLILIAFIVAPISGIFNNTAVVAIFLPMIVNISKVSRTAATKLLIPLSFLAMLGGTLTLIGSSANILANSILEDSGYEAFNLFSFTHIGLIVLTIGLIYLLTIGRFLLPNRKNENSDERTETQFLAELQVEKNSKFIDKHLKEIPLLNAPGIKVIKVLRGEKSYIKNKNRLKLQENDILVLRAGEQKIIDLDSRENEKMLLNFDRERRRMTGKAAKLVKVVVPSIFHRRSVGRIKFWDKFRAAIIGINREDIHVKRLEDMRLKRSDIFLIKVSASNYSKIRNSKDLILLEEIEQAFNRKKSLTAISIMILVVTLAALGIMPIMVSAILGVVLMFVTGCLSTEEVYESVSWDVIFLLAGLIPLGIAMQESGAADMLAALVVDYSSYLSPILIFALFYLFTTLLTEIISNNAAIVLIVPIAISVATKLGIDPMALTLVVMFAASTSFLSPVGYQTNTMVYSAGNYKFSDFIKVGGLLNILLLIATCFSIYHFFGV